MKQILLCLAFVISIHADAQTRKDVKIYGFSQPVIGGANPDQMPDETGVARPANSNARKNYFVYITAPKGQRLYPMEIWLEGQQYSTRTSSVASTPVTLTINTGETEPKKVILVPKTSSAVYHVTPAPGTPAKTLAIAAQLSHENEVVISYRLGGKVYYSVLKKLSTLDPAALQ